MANSQQASKEESESKSTSTATDQQALNKFNNRLWMLSKEESRIRKIAMSASNRITSRESRSAVATMKKQLMEELEAWRETRKKIDSDPVFEPDSGHTEHNDKLEGYVDKFIGQMDKYVMEKSPKAETISSDQAAAAAAAIVDQKSNQVGVSSGAGATGTTDADVLPVPPFQPPYDVYEQRLQLILDNQKKDAELERMRLVLQHERQQRDIERKLVEERAEHQAAMKKLEERMKNLESSDSASHPPASYEACFGAKPKSSSSFAPPGGTYSSRPTRMSGFAASLYGAGYSATGASGSDDAEPPEPARYRRSVFKLPRLDLKPFDGHPSKWPDFIANFEDLVHNDGAISDTQKIVTLRQCLNDDVKASLGSCLSDPAMYDDAINELKSTYGNPCLIVQTYISALKKLPQVNKSDAYKPLLSFATQLRGVVASLRAGGFPQELKSSAAISIALEKLPNDLKAKWGMKIVDAHPMQLDLADLSEWVHKRVKGAMMVHYEALFEDPENSSSDNDKGKHKKKKSGHGPARSVFTASKPTSMQPSNPNPATTNDGNRHLKASGSSKCFVCSGPHLIENCPSFQSKSLDERAVLIKEHGVCLRCLKKGHRGRECPSDRVCGVDGCLRRHHSLLHGAPQIFVRKVSFAGAPQPEKLPELPQKGCNMTTSESLLSTVLVPVVPITIWNGSTKLDSFALLDGGSEATLITQKAARALNLHGPSYTARLATFHGSDPDLQVSIVKFAVSARDETYRFTVSAGHVVPKLNLPARWINWPKTKSRWSHLNDLELSAVDSSRIAILLGRDVPGVNDVFESRRPAAGSSGPEAIRTPFGWSVVGPVPSNIIVGVAQRSFVNLLHSPTLNYDQLLLERLDRQYSTDSFGIVAKTAVFMSPDERRAIAILKASIRHDGTRYETRLMWKTDDAVLPNNYNSALSQFLALERRLSRQPELAVKYDAEVLEYVRQGYAKLACPTVQPKPGREWYLPHHGVTSPSKPGRIRVVHNCSAVYRGVSLNGCLLKGPDLLTNSIGALLRFRAHPIAVVADIAKMYFQVRVAGEDQSVLRFLYRSPGEKTPPLIYQMVVHVFGATSSPTACMFALQQTADDFQSEFPDEARDLMRHTYVDNLMFSASTLPEAIRRSHNFKALCGRGGFDMTKWMSSSREVLASFRSEDLASPLLNLDRDPLPVESTLGTKWNCQTDTFVFSFERKSDVQTPRELLSEIASIHDPLGHVSVVTIVARVLMQNVRRLKLGWDDPLPFEAVSAWSSWVSELPTLAELKIPRCLRRPGTPISAQLHVFCDASEKSFGAVVYLRTVYDSGEVSTRIVIGKTRVAPIKQLTIPRLELQGSIVGVRIGTFVAAELDMPECSVFYWCDSQTVLQWIHSTKCKFHTFVAHRVTEIAELSHPNQWRYVPSALNPADDCSRGLKASILTPEHRWFVGPDFLYQPEEFWPSQLPLMEPDIERDPDVSPVKWLGAVSIRQPHRIFALAKKMSSLVRFKRVVAWLLRFTRNYPNTTIKTERRPLLAKELRDAMTFATKVDQHHFFRREIVTLKRNRPIPPDSKLYHLSPFLDELGVIRVGGRIEHCLALPEDARHPPIFHHDSPVIRLVIADLHVRLCHSSPERTVSDLRMQCHVLRVRPTVKFVINRCFDCKLRNAQPVSPLMAPLPACRLQAHLPLFTHTGIDYFGPIEVVMLRRKIKRYGVIFTCLDSRAVHLEIASFLDTESFLMAFWRFVDRRGCPAHCYSDNGTNLVAGEKEIRQLLAALDQQRISDELSARVIQWHFNPPAAPHFGGVWERLIKSAKSALCIVLRDRTVTEEVLVTALVGVEALLNGRPLTHVSVDAADPEPLTPFHFILGRGNPGVPVKVTTDFERVHPRKRWQASQAIVSHFWRRWLKEYVPSLIERRTWLKSRRNLVVDDVVLVVDPNTPRGEWPIGRIIKADPGPDGVVRIAKVKTKKGVTERPVVKLCLLEQADVAEEVSDQPVVNGAGDVGDGNAVPLPGS